MKKLLFLAGLLIIGLQMNASDNPDILETFGSSDYLRKRHDLQNQISNFTNTDPITIPYLFSIKDNEQGKIQDQLYYLDRDQLESITNKAQWISNNSAQFTDPKTNQSMIVTNPMANVYDEEIKLNMNGTQIASATYTFVYKLQSLMDSINTAHNNMLKYGTSRAPISRGPVRTS